MSYIKGLVIGIVLTAVVWYISDPESVESTWDRISESQSLTQAKSSFSSGSNIKTQCLSQVKEEISLIRAKIPDRGSVRVESSEILETDSEAYEWVVANSFVPHNTVFRKTIKCRGELRDRDEVCKDIESMDRSNFTAVGVSVKVDYNSPYANAVLIPAICDGDGNLMEGSRTMLRARSV